MSDLLELEILTANTVVVREKIIDLYIPAFYGEAGILAHHLPYISVLKAGEVSFLDAASRRHYFYLENGFLEVRDNRIVIMADHLEKAAEMSEADLQNRIKETEARIKSSFTGALTPEELALELDRQKTLQIKWTLFKKSQQR